MEVLRQLVQAFNRRDLATMTQWFAPEVEWEPGGPAALERPRYRGRDEVSSAFARGSPAALISTNRSRPASSS
jgi:ketosteroid isomerase-like protein